MMVVVDHTYYDVEVGPGAVVSDVIDSSYDDDDDSRCCCCGDDCAMYVVDPLDGYKHHLLIPTNYRDRSVVDFDVWDDDVDDDAFDDYYLSDADASLLRRRRLRMDDGVSPLHKWLPCAIIIISRLHNPSRHPPIPDVVLNVRKNRIRPLLSCKI